MKKKLAGAMAALLMFAACQMPAFAAEVPEGGTDYGSFYDETGVMNTEVLQELGEVTLPSVGGAYGVDLHVECWTMRTAGNPWKKWRRAFMRNTATGIPIRWMAFP